MHSCGFEAGRYCHAPVCKLGKQLSWPGTRQLTIHGHQSPRAPTNWPTPGVEHLVSFTPSKHRLCSEDIGPGRLSQSKTGLVSSKALFQPPERFMHRTTYCSSRRSTHQRGADNGDLISGILQILHGFEVQAEQDDFQHEFGLTKKSAKAYVEEFCAGIARCFDGWEDESNWMKPKIFKVLKQAFIEKGEMGMSVQLKFALQGHIANKGFTASDVLNQAKLADLRYPYEWYPGTRALQRKIHLHVGPTNSGKTYNALKRLEQASSGLYAGPLRLLAHEVYTRLNAKGKACHLITGDERIFNESEADCKMVSSTVEMVSVNREVEVAVVDEIQMIAHKERGWAWTQALLGIRAQELHLCGEERVVPLITELATAMGDQLEIHHYERLSPLRPMSKSLNGSLKQLRKGDCLVCFSRLAIHRYKIEIEKVTGKRVAVVYGALPPEIRAQQARLFNDPDNDFDILVASDAIGMGLNLSIKRIIFETTMKYSGGTRQPISIPELKQIAGRAGRYSTATQDIKALKLTTESSDRDIESTADPPPHSITNLGLVTTFQQKDLPAVYRAMETQVGPITSAGIIPPDALILRFATYFPPETPYTYILLRLLEISRTHSTRFYLCDIRDSIGIADIIHPVRGLTTADRITLCAAPVDLRSAMGRIMIKAYAQLVANQEGSDILNIKELDLEVLDEMEKLDKHHMHRLEECHKSVVLYLWLSYRFSGVFKSQAMAIQIKLLLEKRIDMALAEVASKNEFKRTRKETNLSHLHTNMKDSEYNAGPRDPGPIRCTQEVSVVSDNPDQIFQEAFA